MGPVVRRAVARSCQFIPHFDTPPRTKDGYSIAMRELLRELTAPPKQLLRTLQPTPTTVLYTVSTRPRPHTLLARAAVYVGTLVRILVGLATALVLWVKCRYEVSRTEYTLLHILGRLRTDQLLVFVDECQWRYLVPIALVIFFLVFRRNYTGTSRIFYVWA